MLFKKEEKKQIRKKKYSEKNNELKNGEVSGVPLLNFEGGPEVPLLNLRGVGGRRRRRVPLINFEGNPRVLVQLLDHAHIKWFLQ